MLCAGQFRQRGLIRQHPQPGASRIAKCAPRWSPITDRAGRGGADPSELPLGDKPAAAVVRQTKDDGLAEIEDDIDPYDFIKAGDVVPVWPKGKRQRR